jgi:monofunctional biosynthetic peptidoglycan transglycosylase
MALVGCFALSILQVAALKWINPPFTLTILVSPSPPRGINRVWLDIERISPYLIKAVMAAEDQRFLEHGGFDWVEIERAVDEAHQGRRLRGASTISMQVARNVFLWTGRSFVRKALEAYYTFWIELFLSKRRIMTIYLNVVEWGPGVFGAQAAAKYYFGTSAAGLSRVQAARLAAILPSPRRWNPNRPTRYLLERQKFILHNMRNMSYTRLLRH